MRDRPAYPPGLQEVDCGCFDGPRNRDHATDPELRRIRGVYGNRETVTVT